MLGQMLLATVVVPLPWQPDLSGIDVASRLAKGAPFVTRSALAGVVTSPERAVFIMGEDASIELRIVSLLTCIRPS